MAEKCDLCLWNQGSGGGGGGGGGSGGVLVVTVDDQTGTLDHTAQQLIDAGKQGVVILPEDTRPYGGAEITFYQLAAITYNEPMECWELEFSIKGAAIDFYAANFNDYPSINPPG